MSDATETDEPRDRTPPTARLGPRQLTWLGVVVAAGGFALLAVAWGLVAGEQEVYRQVPYLASAALPGVALVIVGMTAVNVASRQQDQAQRDGQMRELITILAELHEQPSGEGRP